MLAISNDIGICCPTGGDGSNRDKVFKIVISVALTATGLLCYKIPGVGWVVGGSLTSAGIQGLL